jgi:ABC-2 type transport system permease protein
MSTVSLRSMWTHARRHLSLVAAMTEVGFSMYLAYPAGVAMVFISYPIVIMMYRYVFNAVYAHGTELAGYNLMGILTYVTVSWILNTFYMTPTGRNLGARIRDGQVAMDLIKPVNLSTLYFGQSMGRTGFRAIFATIPLVAVFALLGLISPPHVATLPQFTLAIIAGYLINFYLDYMIGLIACYIGYNNGIRWAIRMVMNIAGGMVIPLDYFPPALEQTFRLFPTQFMFFIPTQIYLGKLAPLEAWGYVAQSYAWVAGLIILSQIMQRDGVRRLSLAGG